MKKLFLIVLVLMTALSAKAQDKISGRLVDENGAAVEFANIVIKTIEGKATTAGISNENGEFTFNVEDGRFILEASSVGYETLTITTSAGDLGELTMPKDIQQLNAATVQSQRTVQKAGRYLIVPDSKEVMSSARGIDLLSMQQLPGLRVDRGLQSITIDGGTPIFQINGREVPSSRITNLNPEKVKRIEYSNNPGIRYMDRGARGVINIILKESEDGGSIYANAESALNTGFVNSYTNISYHKGKSELALIYNFSLRGYKEGPNIDVESYISPERTVERTTHMDTPVHYTYNGLNLEYTYQKDDSTMFVAALKDAMFHQPLKGTGMMKKRDRDIDYSIDILRRVNARQQAPTLDLYFSHNMANSQKIEFNVVGDYSSMKQELDLTYKYSDHEDKYLTIINNRGWAVSAEGVYCKNFDKVNTRLGVQYQHNYAKNDYARTNSLTEMTKDNTYLFTSAEGPIGDKANWSVGTGAKIFAVTDGNDSKTYVRNLSSAMVSWKMNDNWSLSGDMSFVPNLPSLGNLSPYILQIDDIEASQGNPLLKPSEDLGGRIQIRYAAKKGWYADVALVYDHSFNEIVSTYGYNPTYDLFVASPQNSKYCRTMYASAEAGVKGLWEFLNISLDAKYMHQQSKGETFLHNNNNFTSNINVQAVWEKFNMGAYFNLRPEWVLSGEILSKSEQGQTIYAQYRFKNLTASINWLCPFNKKGFSYETRILSEAHPLYHINYTSDNGNMIALGLSWNFGFGKSFHKGQKTLHNGGYDAGIVQ